MGEHYYRFHVYERKFDAEIKKRVNMCRVINACMSVCHACAITQCPIEIKAGLEQTHTNTMAGLFELSATLQQQQQPLHAEERESERKRGRQI